MWFVLNFQLSNGFILLEFLYITIDIIIYSWIQSSRGMPQKFDMEPTSIFGRCTCRFSQQDCHPFHQARSQSMSEFSQALSHFDLGRDSRVVRCQPNCLHREVPGRVRVLWNRFKLCRKHSSISGAGHCLNFWGPRTVFKMQKKKVAVLCRKDPWCGPITSHHVMQIAKREEEQSHKILQLTVDIPPKSRCEISSPALIARMFPASYLSPRWKRMAQNPDLHHLLVDQQSRANFINWELW